MSEETTSANLPRRLGRYDVVQHLWSGSASSVLIGRLDVPGTSSLPVAIKRIDPELVEQKGLDVFLATVRAAAAVRHANLVEVRDIVSADDELLVVMEYLQGETVRSLMRQMQIRGQTLDHGVAAHLVGEVGAAVAAAHDRGILHEHLAPDEVFIGYDGSIKLLDLGVASALAQMAGATTIRSAELPYAAPERCKGEPLERQSDVFSLGAILWELMTGISPFERPTEAETIRAIISEEPALPPAVLRKTPTQLYEIVIRALTRDRRKRYATARALRHELRTFVRGLPNSMAPSVALAAVMKETFEHQIKSNTELQQRLAAALPEPPPVDASVVDRPTIEAGFVTLSSDALVSDAVGDEMRPPRPRRRTILGVVAAGVVALAAFPVVRLAWAPTTSRPGGAPSDRRIVLAPSRDPARASAAPDVSAIAPEVEPVQVTLAIDTQPTKATIVIDGVVMGSTPVELKLPRGREPLAVEIQHAGYQTLKERVVPDVDQRLRLTLTLLTPVRPAAPQPSSAPYHRFD